MARHSAIHYVEVHVSQPLGRTLPLQCTLITLDIDLLRDAHNSQCLSVIGKKAQVATFITYFLLLIKPRSG